VFLARLCFAGNVLSTGYSVNGKCYADAGAATDAYYSLMVPVSSQVSLMTYLTIYEKNSSTGVWMVSQYRDTNGTVVLASSAPLPRPGFGACDGAADIANSGAIWVFFFSATIALWWFSKNLGLVVNAVRRW
jgi:hypothetical protein